MALTSYRVDVTPDTPEATNASSRAVGPPMYQTPGPPCTSPPHSLSLGHFSPKLVPSEYSVLLYLVVEMKKMSFLS